MKAIVTFILLVYQLQIFAATSACGKIISYLFQVDTKEIYTLSDPMTSNEEFCDEGRNEYNANYRLELLDRNKKFLYHKNIYLSNTTITEETSKKNGKFIKSKIEFLGATRIVRFPSNAQTTQAKYFKITNLKKKREQIGEIVWPK